MDETKASPPDQSAIDRSTHIDLEGNHEENPGVYKYPFSSAEKEYIEIKGHKEGKDYNVWYKDGFNLQEAIDTTHSPIIEIGGPTEGGYYFLDGINLTSKVQITNLNKDSIQKLSYLVNEEFDARHLPYQDKSVGMILMEGIDLTKPELNRVDISDEENNNNIKQARIELEKVAIGALDPKDAKYNQLAQIYTEAYRVLQDEGLLLANGDISNIGVLQRLGLELVAFYQSYIDHDLGGVQGAQYDIIMRKNA